MLINFSAELQDFHGRPIKGDGDAPATLGFVALQALAASFQEEKPDAGRSVRRYKLGVRIAMAEGPLNLTVEEANEIKLVIGKAFGPVVVGSAYDLIEAAQ